MIEGLVVAEFGEAQLVSAEGELPWKPAPGYSYRYADLTGPRNAFATIDYSEEPPVVFQGTETNLKALGVIDVGRTSARTKLTTLNCPNCAGAFELVARPVLHLLFPELAGTPEGGTALADAFRRELAPWGLKVSVVEPGRIPTPIWDTSIERAED